MNATTSGPGTASGRDATPTLAGRDLRRVFGHGDTAVAALAGIDIEVHAGELTVVTGPSGSGKTTLLNLLGGLDRPTSGTVELLGQPYPQAGHDALQRVGALVEGPAFHPYLSARANLRRIDAADRTADPRTAAKRIDAALDRVGLLPAANKNFRIFSLGMKQRLAIAATLLMPRDLLVLDEPTASLDPAHGAAIGADVAVAIGSGGNVDPETFRQALSGT